VSPAVLDHTHDPTRRSRVGAANALDAEFPIQNLPFGVFDDGAGPRVGVAIGDHVLDLSRVPLPVSRDVVSGPTLNPFMALGAAAWTETRRALCHVLTDGVETPAVDWDQALRPLSGVTLHMPFAVAEFTDFYASRHHATNVGSMFRDPDKALMPNWRHMPVGYNGRASTVVVDGTDIRRPMGQILPPGAERPIFAPTAKLDIEVELGAVVGTPSGMGTRVDAETAEAMIFGYVLLNDWSARDIQVWEYQPLGPFQAKAFATTISPWIVTRDALAAARTAGPVQDIAPLPHLSQSEPRGLDIALEAALTPVGENSETVLCRPNGKDLYWSGAQQLAHHTACGCAMRTGDLLGSGTISGTEPASRGCLLELAWNGRDPVPLTGGGTRSWLADGDTVILRGHGRAEGYRIGFGQASGRVLPAIP
jgi:fumarylacetoacetase